MKISSFILLFFYTCSSFAGERMVFFSMVSPQEKIQEGNKLYQHCSLEERGAMMKEKYYKIDGQRKGRYCSVSIDSEAFDSHFKFCALSKFENSQNDARGMCSFNSVNEGYSFTAENSEPDGSFASKYCYFVCLTTEKAEPNMTNSSAKKTTEQRVKDYLHSSQ